MATETRTLPDISKTAISLVLERNNEALQRVCQQALAREGLLEGGWQIDKDLNASREVADDSPVTGADSE